MIASVDNIKDIKLFFHLADITDIAENFHEEQYVRYVNLTMLIRRAVPLFE